jgi:hypothetical protein
MMVLATVGFAVWSYWSNHLDQPSDQSRRESLNTGDLTWSDPATRLMWAKKDNGSDVNWQQATNYCRNLQLSGYSDWHLATIDELKGIYDANANIDGCHVKGNLQLSSSWYWSSSRGNASGEAFYFGFNDGIAALLPTRLPHGLRALCVRHLGK